MWMNTDNSLAMRLRPEIHTFENTQYLGCFISHKPEINNKKKHNKIWAFVLLSVVRNGNMYQRPIHPISLISLWMRIWQMEESRRMLCCTCLCFIVNFNKFTAIIYENTSSLGHCMVGWCMVWLKVGGFGIFMFLYNFILLEARRMTNRNGWNGKRVKMNRDRITLLGLKSINYIPLLTNENITAASAIKKNHTYSTV